ncbi:hypothetical protein DdX_21856 [Ditylenchus destructor]|uniref:Uncharacterized protein n=1 Tax=Ditylenchus destructor TaxID=166010 RepID=A0AAD4QSU2_9BILA|nr:hypothetical protein DdX_21856 [Ditylenchus destructor]
MILAPTSTPTPFSKARAKPRHWPVPVRSSSFSLVRARRPAARSARVGHPLRGFVQKFGYPIHTPPCRSTARDREVDPFDRPPVDRAGHVGGDRAGQPLDRAFELAQRRRARSRERVRHRIGQLAQPVGVGAERLSLTAGQ